MIPAWLLKHRAGVDPGADKFKVLWEEGPYAIVKCSGYSYWNGRFGPNEYVRTVTSIVRKDLHCLDGEHDRLALLIPRIEGRITKAKLATMIRKAKAPLDGI